MINNVNYNYKMSWTIKFSKNEQKHSMRLNWLYEIYYEYCIFHYLEMELLGLKVHVYSILIDISKQFLSS